MKIVSFPNYKRNNLVDMVFEALKDTILAGDSSAGDRLPTQDILADEFGVSRTVIREAVNKLSSLGLVESRQGQGTFIRSPDVNAIMSPMLNALHLDETSTAELIEVRYFLERMVARLAAKRIRPQQVAEIEEIIQRMRLNVAGGNIEEFSRADFAFHQKLAFITQNRVLMRILETIREMQCQFLLTFSRTEGAAERAIEFHTRILQAVAAGNAAKAEKEMELHLLDVVNALREYYNFDLDI